MVLTRRRFFFTTFALVTFIALTFSSTASADELKDSDIFLDDEGSGLGPGGRDDEVSGSGEGVPPDDEDAFPPKKPDRERKPPITPVIPIEPENNNHMGPQPPHEDKDKEQILNEKPTHTSFFSQPGILAAIICGAIVGLLCAILLVMFIVYRMRKKDEGSYVLDDSKRTGSGYGKTKEFFA